MIDDLKELLRVRSNMDADDFGEIPTTPDDEYAWKDDSSNFLRDHGQALLEAVSDSDRLDWLFRQWSGEALRHIGVVYSEPSEYRQAIDFARSKTVDGGGA